MFSTGPDRRPDPDRNTLQFFPFMSQSSWYEEYWYQEREPGRLRKLIGRVLQLRTKLKIPSAIRVTPEAPQPNPMLAVAKHRPHRVL